jgi:ligand-binding sensor domain-containing protein
MKNWLFSLYQLIVLLLTTTAAAQNSSFVFERYDKMQGLPGKTITIIYQDSRHFIWIGTEHGIVRYDGKFFKHYNQIGEGGITDRIITCITEDATGNIWFGTESGLNRLNPFTNSITQFNEGSGPGTIPFRWCNALFTDNKKQLWLTTEKGIALYNSRQNTFINYPITVAGKDEKINKFINQIVQDKENNLWLSTSYGIKKFNPLTKKYQSWHKEETAATMLGDNVYYGICIDKTGTIWAITFGGQLFRYNKIADKFELAFTATDKTMRFAGISSFENEKSSSLLIATSNGLLQLNPNNLQQPAVQMLAGNSLTRSFTDRQQNLWVASTNGLFRHSAVSLALQWHNLPDAAKPFVYHFIPAINDPQHFFLTTTAGWYKYNSSTNLVTEHTLPPDKKELLKNINRFSADDNGYWFTSVKGFGYYNTTSNQLTDLTHIVESATGQAATGYIVSPEKKQLWFTVRRSGIMVYNTATKKDTLLFGNKEKPDNVYGIGISDLKIGAGNKVWFTAAGKLYSVNPATLAHKTYSPDISNRSNNKTEPYHILFTKDGRIIVNSVSNIYELKNEKLTLVYPAKGLFNFALYKLLESEKGELWAVTDEGLYKTNKQFSVWKNMSSFSGLENERPGFEINLLLPGKIMLGSDGRIGILNEAALQQNTAPNPAIISRIRLGEK